MMYLFNRYEEKILMLGNFDLNSVQQCTDSVKEVFKQTMLKQDIIFRKQVHELHRVYNVQKTLMNNVGFKEHEKYNSWGASTQSLAQETRFPSNPMAVVGTSRQPIGQELVEGHRGNYHKLHPSTIDLHPKADQCISHVTNKFPSTIEHDSEKIVDLNSLHGDNSSESLDLRLSLSFEADNWRNKCTKRTRLDKKTNPCPPIFIDLEESDEDDKHAPSLGGAPRSSYFGGNHDSQITITSDPFNFRGTKKETSDKIQENSFFVEESTCYQEQKSSNQDFIACHYKHNNLSARKQQFIPYEVGHFDLNNALQDDSSCNHNIPMMAYHSTAFSSGNFNEKVDGAQERSCPSPFLGDEICKFSSESIGMHQKIDDPNLASMNSKSTDKREDILVTNSKLNGGHECEASHIGITSVLRPQLGFFEHLGSKDSSPKNERDESILELQSSLLHGPSHTCSAVPTKVRCEKAEDKETLFSCSDQSQITVEDKRGDKSSASGNPFCVADNDSSSVKTMQSGIESGNSNRPASEHSSGSNIGSQAVETFSCEQDQRSSGSSELKNECYSRNEKFAEVDIQQAAESLIQISLQKSACYQGHSTQAGSNRVENAHKEQPQFSSDSFELLTLKLTESSADDYCVSSKPSEVSDSENKDFSFRLRRGRRLKDFQRDILPGLASLSRHEIHEDINILEGVLRSREYKKMRAKLANAENWCTPVRSRRSRLNYVGRRNFR